MLQNKDVSQIGHFIGKIDGLRENKGLSGLLRGVMRSGVPDAESLQESELLNTDSLKRQYLYSAADRKLF